MFYLSSAAQLAFRIDPFIMNFRTPYYNVNVECHAQCTMYITFNNNSAFTSYLLHLLDEICIHSGWSPPRKRLLNHLNSLSHRIHVYKLGAMAPPPLLESTPGTWRNEFNQLRVTLNILEFNGLLIDDIIKVA